jgi:hypothetical protein
MPRPVLGLAICLLALAACGESQQTGNTSSIDEAVSAEDFETNDVTAIDAATGADANMAADVDINVYQNETRGEGNESAGRDSAPRRPRAPANTVNASDEPAPEPAEPREEPAESNSL